MKRIAVSIQPLTRASFAPFGDVIEVAGNAHHTINKGWAERYHDLAKIDVGDSSGRPLVSIVRARMRALPMRVELVECHPLSSQAFIPLHPRPFLIIVASAGTKPRPEDLLCFQTNGAQGINYARGTWHHPLIALLHDTDFLVIDSATEGANCNEVPFGDVEILVGA
jgi:ureidoglycolate lyase